MTKRVRMYNAAKVLRVDVSDNVKNDFDFLSNNVTFLPNGMTKKKTLWGTAGSRDGTARFRIKARRIKNKTELSFYRVTHVSDKCPLNNVVEE